MTTATDGAALLRGVIDFPEDDDRRLVFADWLEEDGQSERAEFVRVQVELARLDTDQRQGECTTPGPECSDPDCPSGRRARECRPLQKRGRELLIRRRLDWFVQAREFTPEALRYDDFIPFRRGFVESVRCPIATWLTHGPAVVLAHPVQTVTITDREPKEVRGTCGWWRSYHPIADDDLPTSIWDLLEGGDGGDGVGGGGLDDVGWRYYDSRELALSALSSALIRWAKLPPEERG